VLDRAFAAAGVDPGARGEQLDVAVYARLAQHLGQHLDRGPQEGPS
jgi:hypothetical protein